MRWKLIILFSLSLNISPLYTADDIYPSVESQLLHDLFTMSKYDPAARPIRNASEALKLSLEFYLIDIVDLDIRHEILVTNVLLAQYWTDELLRWNPDKYGGIKRLHIQIDRIWSPDLRLLNDAGETKNNLVKPKAVVNHDGQVEYAPIKQLRSQCAVDVSYFPFDRQTCRFDFYPWTNIAAEVHLMLKRSDQRFNVLNMVNLLRPGVFRIFDGHINASCNVHEQDEGSLIQVDDNGNVIPYCFINAKISLARRPLHYIYTTIFPTILVSILSLLVFRLNPESGEKIGLSITLVLVFHVLLWSLGEKMPESARSVPLLAIYLTTVLALTTLSLFMCVAVLNFYSKGSAKQVPHWMRWFILDKVAHLLCFDRAHRYAKPKKDRQKAIHTVERLLDDLQLEDSLSDMEVTKALHLIALNHQLEKEEEKEISREWQAVALVMDKVLFLVFGFVILVVTVYMIAVYILIYDPQPEGIFATLAEEGFYE